MTAREAVMQAYLELGMTREDAELRGKYADGVIPDAVPFTGYPIEPGHERELVDCLKRVFRYMDAHPQEIQALLKNKMAKRTSAN